MRQLQPSTDKGQTGPLGRVDPSLPQVFGRYLLVQRLSRGGMGEIFLAKHGLAGFEKLAVIKKVLPHLAADEQFISRFVDEAQVAIKLQHVNVAQVFEVGRVGDEYFLALEYVEGRDLRRTLAVLQQRATRLPVDLGLFIGRELANGLAYAHRRTSNDGASLNLVHCDISPPNVLVSFEGETKVIDFGIAKSALRGTATDPKMGFGKFGYMAPEQLIRGGIVDHRTDIYAAGVVLFELLTGMRLYEAGPEPDYRALAKKVAKGEHKMPSDVEPTLAPYDDLVATALRPKPEDRYQTAAEFRDAIQQALVNVNPTISTDQLGAYMRELFQHEMTAQRELHERIAKTHLEDFHDQLTTQVGSTISFALANMPLTAPPDPPKLPASRNSGAVAGLSRARPPTTPTEILGQKPSLATSVVPTTELALADGTGSISPEDLEEISPRRSKKPVVFASVAAMLAIGVVAFAMMRTGDKPQPQPKVVTPPQPAIHVETIPPEEQTPPPASSGAATMPVDKPAIDKTAKPPDKKHDKRSDKKRDKKIVAEVPKTAPAVVKPELTREAVAAKFRAVKQAYDNYKQKNGGRFDQEWNDLASYAQYHSTELEEVARRIESFKAKLRE
jgi:eukaryotic-like serine/threonine-protein kinase